MHLDNSILLAGLIVAGVACQWLSWFTKIPAILYLLILGITTGPILNVLNPDVLLGESLFPFISLAVAVILFEGSLSLNFRELQQIGAVIRNLVTVGCAITCLLCTLVAGLLFDIPWGLAAIFGSIMTVSGPAVIAPMLRAIRPTPAVAKILRWEGILIDPVGATLTVLVYELMTAYYSGQELTSVSTTFFKICGYGLALGTATGWGYGTLLKRHLIPEFLQNTTSLGLVFLVFTVANSIEHESGLLAVTVMGMVLGNLKNIDLRMMVHFKESLSMILISTLFILLASRLDMDQFLKLGWRGLLLLVVIQFVIRPISVWACTRRSNLSLGEIKLLSWIAPRGVVAAAVASLVSLKMQAQGIPHAEQLVSLSFLVIIGTVTFECLTATKLAKKWDAAVPASHGVLICGANVVARALGEILGKNGISVLLADSSRNDVVEARMAGLKVYYGNPVSEDAENNMDIIGLGKMMAIGPDEDENLLMCAHFTHEFGKRNIYCLSTASDEQKKSQKHQVRREYRGYTLFGSKVTYAYCASLLAMGSKFLSTKLTEEFQFEDLKKQHIKALVLFAISTKGDLHSFVERGNLQPLAGWTVITLVLPKIPGDPETTILEIKPEISST